MNIYINVDKYHLDSPIDFKNYFKTSAVSFLN